MSRLEQSKSSMHKVEVPRCVLEVCVDSLQGARTAVLAGADRLELCSGLSVGGLTPSFGAIRNSSELGVPVVVLIRPFEGGFQYGSAEISQMRDDIQCAHDAGASGVAIGALNEDGMLDLDVMGVLCEAASGMDVVLHRAFDLTPCPLAALEAAVDLGVTRILTSGQKLKAFDGRGCLKQLVKAARGRIEVLPGSGVTIENAIDILNDTGVTQLHASCRVQGVSDPALTHFGFESIAGMPQIDPWYVSQLKAIMERVQ